MLSTSSCLIFVIVAVIVWGVLYHKERHRRTIKLSHLDNKRFVLQYLAIYCRYIALYEQYNRLDRLIEQTRQLRNELAELEGDQGYCVQLIDRTLLEVDNSKHASFDQFLTLARDIRIHVSN